MKRIQLSLIALVAGSSFSMAGGDIAPIEFYEEVVQVEAVPVEPVVEAVVPTPIPEPVVIPAAEVLGIYAGIGLVATRYDTNCDCSNNKSGTDKTAGIMARVGYDFNKYVGLEARGMRTNWKSDGGKIKHAGVFVKPMVPVGDATNIYGLLGLAKTTTQGDLRKTDAEGLAFGAGVEYDLSNDKKKDAKYDREFDGIADQEKGLGLFADYERLYYQSDSPDLDAVSVGITYDF